jgi:hypothetical protein
MLAALASSGFGASTASNNVAEALRQAQTSASPPAESSAATKAIAPSDPHELPDRRRSLRLSGKSSGSSGPDGTSDSQSLASSVAQDADTESHLTGNSLPETTSFPLDPTVTERIDEPALNAEYSDDEIDAEVMQRNFD